MFLSRSENVFCVVAGLVAWLFADMGIPYIGCFIGFFAGLYVSHKVEEMFEEKKPEKVTDPSSEEYLTRFMPK